MILRKQMRMIHWQYYFQNHIKTTVVLKSCLSTTTTSTMSVLSQYHINHPIKNSTTNTHPQNYQYNFQYNTSSSSSSSSSSSLISLLTSQRNNIMKYIITTMTPTINRMKHCNITTGINDDSTLPPIILTPTMISSLVLDANNTNKYRRTSSSCRNGNIPNSITNMYNNNRKNQYPYSMNHSFHTNTDNNEMDLDDTMNTDSETDIESDDDDYDEEDDDDDDDDDSSSNSMKSDTDQNDDNTDDLILHLKKPKPFVNVGPTPGPIIYYKTKKETFFQFDYRNVSIPNFTGHTKTLYDKITTSLHETELEPYHPRRGMETLRKNIESLPDGSKFRLGGGKKSLTKVGDAYDKPIYVTSRRSLKKSVQNLLWERHAMITTGKTHNWKRMDSEMIGRSLLGPDTRMKIDHRLGKEIIYELWIRGVSSKYNRLIKQHIIRSAESNYVDYLNSSSKQEKDDMLHDPDNVYYEMNQRIHQRLSSPSKKYNRPHSNKDRHN